MFFQNSTLEAIRRRLRASASGGGDAGDFFEIRQTDGSLEFEGSKLAFVISLKKLLHFRLFF